MNLVKFLTNMSVVQEDLGISEALKSLGIKAENNGASTGSKWFKTRGAKIESYSPVDGKLIGSVNAATDVDYEAAVLKAQEAFIEWKLFVN
jgi:aldehyde dehydrogenase (NAD+)